MEGNKKNFFKKRGNPQFKKKGGTKKGKGPNSSREQSSKDSHASDTLYRILCQSRKIGSVIGKGGDRIKSLREETQAKITVQDSVPGSDERVIIICSPSTKLGRKQNNDNSDGEDAVMRPHCAAQDALLKVHDRIIEEDLGSTNSGDRNETVVTVRLLVPDNMVGCLLGRKGDVIQKLRSETGANIRVLASEHLPTCAMSTDELVQISGKLLVAKNALYEVSTLLHQNPRKDKPLMDFPTAHGHQGFHPSGPPKGNIAPLDNPVWSQRHLDPHGMPPPALWMEEYGNRPGFGRGDIDGIPPPHGGDATKEFVMKILCSAGKIGGVIGKGGLNVKQLQQETGASIHVEDVSAESDERVIRVSAFEALWNPRSETIDAILVLQDKTSEFSEKGTITTRLLVPSSKVGCLLGQGGQVINEMRRRTQADIRVLSKEDKPKCAAENEELVQVSGSIGVARDALAEIATRLRTRYLRDGNPTAEPVPVRPLPGFGPGRNLAGAALPPSVGIRGGGSSRYEYMKGGHELDPPSYSSFPSGSREFDPPSYPSFRSGSREFEPPSYPSGGREIDPNYPSHRNMMGHRSLHNSLDMRIPDDVAPPGARGSNIEEVVGARMKYLDPRSIGSDRGAEIRRSSEYLGSSHQSMYEGFVSSSEPGVYPHQGAYQSAPPEHGGYPHQAAYQGYDVHPEAYPGANPSQMPHPNQGAPYQSAHMQPPSYQNLGAQHSFQY